jgi:hypothetical protein
VVVKTNFEKSSTSGWDKGFKGARISESQMKTVLITFFDIEMIVPFEFIPQGRTVNQAYCVETLKRLHEALHFGPIIGSVMLQLTRRSLSSSFWPKNLLLKWNTHPIPVIWFRVTFGCFQK